MTRFWTILAIGALILSTALSLESSSLSLMGRLIARLSAQEQLVPLQAGYDIVRTTAIVAAHATEAWIQVTQGLLFLLLGLLAYGMILAIHERTLHEAHAGHHRRRTRRHEHPWSPQWFWQRL
jgi:hypothetical protein